MKKKILFSLLLLGVFIGTTHGQGGNFVWAHSIESSDYIYGHKVTTDNAGNIYAIGNFKGSVDFNNQLAVDSLTANDNSWFILKENSNGFFVWVKSISGLLSSNSRFIAVDDTGNVYISGRFENTVDFDPGPGIHSLTSNGDYDFFVLKLDTHGDFVWAKSIGETGRDRCRNMAIDHAGNLYLTGSFQGTVDFDPGAGTSSLIANSFYDCFILKLDGNGNFVWAKNMGGTGVLNSGIDIAVDDLENVYTTGYFYNTIDIDPGPGIYSLNSYGGRDVFIQKLDANGDFVWGKSVGSGNDEEASSVALDASNNVVTSGRFSGLADFDPGSGTFILNTINNWGNYVLKLDHNGDFIWAKGILPTTTNGVLVNYELVIDTLNNIFAWGTYKGSYDFDPGTGAHILSFAGGSGDGYFLKLDSTGNFVWAHTLAGIGYDFYRGGTIDHQGNIISTGVFNATVDFDPGPNTHNLTSTGSPDLFILKLSACETSVGIAENNTTPQAIAYPNPTSGVVTLDLEDIKDATIKVLNINGQVVYQQAQVNGIHQFELAGASGVYTIEVSTATIRKYVKLVRQ